MKITVLFGSFNPMTKAHISAMKTAVNVGGEFGSVLTAKNGSSGCSGSAEGLAGCIDDIPLAGNGFFFCHESGHFVSSVNLCRMAALFIQAWSGIPQSERKVKPFFKLFSRVLIQNITISFFLSFSLVFSRFLKRHAQIFFNFFHRFPVFYEKFRFFP